MSQLKTYALCVPVAVGLYFAGYYFGHDFSYQVSPSGHQSLLSLAYCCAYYPMRLGHHKTTNRGMVEKIDFKGREIVVVGADSWSRTTEIFASADEPVIRLLEIGNLVESHGEWVPNITDLDGRIEFRDYIRLSVPPRASQLPAPPL